MSSNLDLVRSIYAAWERGDLSSTEWAHPDIEYVEHGGLSHAGLAPGRSKGLAEMAEAAREFVSVWDGWSIVAEEMRELDDQRVESMVTAPSVGGRTAPQAFTKSVGS